MSSEWPLVAVEDVCELIVDCVNKTAPIVEEPTPYRMIRTTNVRNGRIDLSTCRYVVKETYEKWTRRARLQPGDVILTREAPIGEVGLVNESEGVFLGQRLMQYRADPKHLDPRFLLYSFLSPALQHQFRSHEGSGSVVSHIRVGDCFKFKMRLPPLAIQQEIAALLGALDERIALLRETNVTLEAIAHALFKSWFVDFDPAHARARGEQSAGLAPEVAALFPDSFEESELGMVPKGWSWSVLGNVCTDHGGTIQTGPFGSQLHASDYVQEGTPVVMPKDISGRRVDGGTAARIGMSDVERLFRHQLQIGDIVFSRRGDVEKHALIGELEQGWLCGTGCLLVRPGKNWCSPGFLSRLLDLKSTKRWLTQHAVGATMPNLNTGILAAVPVLLPSREVLMEFEQLTHVLDTRISENNATIQTLANLRDTLLPRLISGQLRLPDAEAMVSEAQA